MPRGGDSRTPLASRHRRFAERRWSRWPLVNAKLEVAIETLLSILDFAALIANMVVIPICFLKGRRGVAWFGLFMFGTGMALSFRAFRYVRDGLLDDWWWWLFNAQGLAVLVLLTSIALSAPKPGSWWDRRNMQGSTSNG